MSTRFQFVSVLFAVMLCIATATANAQPVAQWNFDDGTASDSVGSNNGTLVGNAAIVTDSQRGKVASFDGNGDYIDCGNDASLQMTDNMTVALWFKSNSWTTLHDHYNGIISKRNDFTTALDWEFYFDHNHNELRGLANSDIMFDYDYIYAATNQWHHLAFTKQGTSVKMYIDGILEGTDTTNANWTTTSSLRIGTIGLDGLYDGFNGSIDDVRIYNTALTQQEITQIIPEPATMLLLGLGLLGIKRK